eukprot:m.196208 g.196208  ORF g.196208 m.196208 type:complete len:371 (-) comp15248_c0_seq2:1554-2666(-)
MDTKTRMCAKCAQPATKQCSSCKQAWYCCVECQREHWKAHKTSCKEKQRNSAASSAPSPALKKHTRIESPSSALKIKKNASTGGASSAVLQTIQEHLVNGQQLGQEGKISEAADAFRESMALAVSSLGVDAMPTMQAGDMLGKALVLLWKADVAAGAADNEENEHLENAFGLYKDALATKRKVFGSDAQPTVVACEALAQLQFESGRMVDACQTYDELLKVCRRTMGPKHKTCLGISVNYALALANTQRFKKAIALGKENLTLCREVLGPTHLETLKVACNLTDALAQFGDDAAAASLGSQTFDDCEKTLGLEHPLTKLMAHRADVVDDFLESTTSVTAEELETMWSGGTEDESFLTQSLNFVTNSCTIL